MHRSCLYGHLSFHDFSKEIHLGPAGGILEGTSELGDRPNSGEEEISPTQSLNVDPIQTCTNRYHDFKVNRDSTGAAIGILGLFV